MALPERQAASRGSPPSLTPSEEQTLIERVEAMLTKQLGALRQQLADLGEEYLVIQAEREKIVRSDPVGALRLARKLGRLARSMGETKAKIDALDIERRESGWHLAAIRRGGTIS